MVIVEHFMTLPDGTRLNKARSDAGMYIERDGMLFVDAVDPEDKHREYAETEIPIEDDEEATAEDYEAALDDMGVPV